MQLLAFATCRHQADGLEYRKMLREVGFRDAQSLLQFRRPALAASQHLDQVQARRIGECFADCGLSFVDLKFSICFSFGDHKLPQGTESP